MYLEKIGGFVGDLITAGIGTFIGAYVAFALEKNTRRLESIAKNVSTGNVAILTLFQYWNDIKQFQNEAIKPLLNQDTAWISMIATFQREESTLKIDSSALSFLFDGDDKNLMSEILLEEIRYKLMLSMINNRSKIMLEEVFPTMEKAGIKSAQKVDSRDIEKILGPALTTKIKDLTESIIEHVNENVISIENTAEKLKTQLKKMYPKSEIVGIQKIPEENNFPPTRVGT